MQEKHLIFMNFGVKKFTLKNDQKENNIMFKRYNLVDPIK
jgi:hypothetical protein